VVAISGLVSISFRSLEVAQVIALAQQAGLGSIEWGGDVHVPPGDVETAQRVAAATAKAGLTVSAYGSYYRVGVSETADEPLRFADVLASARALGAPWIRVWAGRGGSARADAAAWAAVVADSKRIADLAGAAGIRIAYEYHGGTLTDSNDSAQRLLDAVDHPQVYSYWQPPNRQDVDYCLAGLQALLDRKRLANLHVFHWTFEPEQIRHPLAAGAEPWSRYLAAIAAADPETERCYSLEFIRGDDAAQCCEDAATLSAWLAGKA
jgi:3-dehydroshikimate dehydratase